MKKETLKEIGAIVFWLGIALAIFGAGQLRGYSKGYLKAFEDQKKWECNAEFGSKAQSEISGECLRYFKIK